MAKLVDFSIIVAGSIPGNVIFYFTVLEITNYLTAVKLLSEQKRIEMTRNVLRWPPMTQPKDIILLFLPNVVSF